MERIQYITALRKYDELSLRALQKKTGHHFDTVKKYVERDDWYAEIKPRKMRESKLDALKPVINEWLERDFKCRESSGIQHPTVTDLLEFNKELLSRCDEDMNRAHNRKKDLISDLLAQDLDVMKPLPKQRYKATRLEKVKTDKYSFVQFESNKYSTVPQYNRCEM
ncbi:MAG: hypothetical protein AB9835_02035 [Eubacteriales bacterium]